MYGTAHIGLLKDHKQQQYGVTKKKQKILKQTTKVQFFLTQEYKEYTASNVLCQSLALPVTASQCQT